MKYLFLYFLIVITFFTTGQHQTFAQTSPDLDKLITTNIVPQTPGPNQDTRIEITSYMYDLTRSKISWYVNGVLKSSNLGQRTFTFTTGEVGSISKVKYSITTPNGVVFGDTINISPGEVNLIWESQGYVPPFYKGKSLFSFEGNARIVAVANLQAPNGTKYKPEELIYTWKRGMGVDTAASGYGKNVFNFTGDIIARPTEIQVEVSNLKNTTKAEGSVIIDSREPELYIYENNPSLGILFNKNVTERYNMLENEQSFVAEPFYYNNPDVDGEYGWSVNGQQAEEKSKYITFRNTAGEEGYSNVSIDLSNQKRIMQSANMSFNIYFGSTNNSPSNLFKTIFGN